MSDQPFDEMTEAMEAACRHATYAIVLFFVIVCAAAVVLLAKLRVWSLFLGFVIGLPASALTAVLILGSLP